MKKTNKKGFTIVELVIVIAVIGILAAILIPTFVNLTDNARAAALQSNLRNAYTAYLADAEGDGVVDGDTTDAKAIKAVGMDEAYLSEEASASEAGKAKKSYKWDSTEEKWVENTLVTLTPVSNSTLAVYNGYHVYYIAA